MDKSYLMELKLSELKTESQKEVFFRYLSIAEHYISTENEKEAKTLSENRAQESKDGKNPLTFATQESAFSDKSPWLLASAIASIIFGLSSEVNFFNSSCNFV